MFTDIHSHLLFGIDDGPKTQAEMETLISLSVADGVTKLIATPHAFPGLSPFDMEKYQTALQKANDYCKKQQLDLQIFGGAEIFYSKSAVRMLQDHLIPTMNGTKYVLVEWRPTEDFDEIHQAVRELANAGFIPVIAHAERILCVLKHLDELVELRAMYNANIQSNCSSLFKPIYSREKRIVKRLCKMKAIDFFASDVHNPDLRPSRMKEAYQALLALVDREYADAVFGNNQSIFWE